MRGLTDTTLRRCAWGATALMVAVIAVRVAIASSAGLAPGGSWGGRGALAEVELNIVTSMFPLAGLVILLRQPRNAIGWLLQGVGLVWSVDCVLTSYATYGLVVDPGALSGPDVAAALNEGMWAPLVGLMVIFLGLLFPDGQLLSPRWRLVAWTAAVSVFAVAVSFALNPGPLAESPVPVAENPLGLETSTAAVRIALTISLLVFTASMVAAATALVLRFRRSTGVVRQQLTWLTTAGAIVALLYAVTAAVTLRSGLDNETPAWGLALQNASIVSFGLLALAVGVAVLRYRLYDIDLVINRALVYGALTALLAVVYLISVLLLQLALSPLTEQSDLAVAGSTLAVAALFRPGRRRIQSWVDQRFYRQRYNAARTLDVFAGRLRHELDLEALGEDLRATVHDTVAPTHVTLWLRPEATS